jgi:hypothetical protein
MMGRVVGSQITLTAIFMTDMNAGSRRGGNAAVKQTTCVCRLIKSRDCNTFGRNIFVDCNTERHSSIITR